MEIVVERAEVLLAHGCIVMVLPAKAICATASSQTDKVQLDWQQ